MTFSELPKELRDDIVANQVKSLRKTVKPEHLKIIGEPWFRNLVRIWLEHGKQRNYSEDGQEIPKEEA